MSIETTKLSKKQQKALKHRSRADKGKGKAVDGDDEDEEAGAFPEQDLEPDEGRKRGESSSSKRKLAKEDNVQTTKNKNNKAITDDGLPYSPLDDAVKPEKATEKSGSKKRKRDAEGGKTGSSSNSTSDQNDKPTKPKQPKNSDSKQRYIVFVGNLPYKVDAEDVIKHFEEPCGEKPSVRLLTTKPPTEKQMNNPNFVAKSKGCAFVEFKTSAAIQAALHLHQSVFISSKSSAKRKINVELTAGGGGNSETRKKKLGELKERLDKQREKHKTEADVAKAKKEEDQKAVREEWKKNEQQNKTQVGRVDGQPAAKKKRAPKFVSGANSTRLG